MFFISPNISGKYSRLEHPESSSVSREVKLRGGKLVSLLQPLAFNILSLFRKPIESSTATKLSHSSNESSLKFGRSDTSGICVKNLHWSKFKTVRCPNFCKGMKRKIFRVEKKNIQRSSIIKLFDSGFHTTCSKEDNFIN